MLEVVEDEGLVQSAKKTAELIWASRDVDSVPDDTDEPDSNDSDTDEDIGELDAVAGSSAQEDFVLRWSCLRSP